MGGSDANKRAREGQNWKSMAGHFSMLFDSSRLGNCSLIGAPPHCSALEISHFSQPAAFRELWAAMAHSLPHMVQVLPSRERFSSQR